MKVSSFQSTTRPLIYVDSAPEKMKYLHYAFKHVEIESIFKAIRSGGWRKQIEIVKQAKGGYDKNKKKLPCFTPSGTFRLRLDWDLIDYSGLVVLDYDKVESASSLRDRLSSSPYCFAAFISPSGCGVKAFVKVDSGENLHGQAWSQVRKVFDTLAGISSDPSGRNISRLCFVSHDADCFYNPDSIKFEVTEAKSTVTIPDASILAGNSETVFKWLYNLTIKGTYQKEVLGDYGKNRNNFLYVFSCNCNRYGVDQQTAFEFVKTIWVQDNLGFSMHELSRTVASAYQHKKEFNTFRLPKHLTS
jgi:VirE N-terminal domain